MKKELSISSKIKLSLISFIQIMAIAFIFRSFVLEPFKIPSGSMMNNLLKGDYIAVSKYSYGYSRHSLPFSIPLIKNRILFKSPERGDIAVFRLPSSTNIFYVKRIIGLPGDNIRISNGTLYINDNQVHVRKLAEHQYADSILYEFEEILPNGRKYRILRDINDNFSHANNTLTYKVPEDHYFALGDNRDRSRDSRFSDVGFIHKDLLSGKARLIVFSTASEMERSKTEGGRFLRVLK